MAVHPASLEVLEKAAVPPAQARAIVQAIEIEIAGAQDTLATKQDALTLKQDILTLRHDTKQDMLTLRHEMAELRSELRHEMQQLATTLQREMAEVRGEFHAAMSSNVRHMYGALMGQFALLLGLAYFFVSHVQH